MTQENCKTNIPVAIFLWKRAENTEKILNLILEYKPEKVFVLIDGPKQTEDKVKIGKVLNTVNKINESSSIPFFMNIANEHLGLKSRFGTGLKWIFKNVDEAIILEDDTIPSGSFFFFCEYYLNKYRNDEKVVAINGSFRISDDSKNLLSIKEPFLNNIFSPWGWATWGTKYTNIYDPEISNLTLKQKLRALWRLGNLDLYSKRVKVLFKVVKGELNTWDVQFQWNIILNRKKVLTSHVNLISNIGLDAEVTTQLKDFNNHLFKPVNEINIKEFENVTPHYKPKYDVVVFRSLPNKKILLDRVSGVIRKLSPIMSKLKILFWTIYRLIKSPKINLVVVGEQRCGSTSFNKMLEQNDNFVTGVIKEKHLFDNPNLFTVDNILKSKKVVSDIFLQGSSFKNLIRCKYFVDVTPDYVFRDESLIRLKKYNPNAKIIYLIRNPVDRFISSYGFYFTTSKYRSSFFKFDVDGVKMKAYYEKNPKLSFEEYYNIETSDKPVFKALRRGLYAENIKLLLKYFSRSNLKIIIFEDIVDPLMRDSVISNLKEFLRIKPDNFNFPHLHKSDHSSIHIDKKYVNLLEDYYRHDLTVLEKEFGISLLDRQQVNI